MLKFYRKTIVVFFGLAVLTALLTYASVERVFVHDALLPAHESAIPWKFEIITDVGRGGNSSASVSEDTYSLNYEYYLTEDIKFPFVIATVAFAELENAERLIDLSEYSSATFKVKCAPSNILNFYVYSFDEEVTDPENFYSYRIASEFFSCDEEWSEIEINLRNLNVPLWWLELANVDILDQNYWLDKVIAIAFDNSRKGPVNTQVEVKISELALHGRDWRYALVLVGCLVLVWSGFIVWFFKSYTISVIEDVRDKLDKDLPFIAYQQLSIEPHKDESKNRVLRFIATEYVNPDLSMEFSIEALGVRRTQINELLKDEFGMTFSVYLNKLRLTEAARLLSDQDDVNVAKIAYSVGYNNVSYFNKLFKIEYGCTPKIFKGLTNKKAELPNAQVL